MESGGGKRSNKNPSTDLSRSLGCNRCQLVLGLLCDYMWNLKNKLMERKTRFVVTRGRGGDGEIG